MSILTSGQLKVIPTTIFEVGGADVVPFTLVTVKKVTFYNTAALAQTVRLDVVEFSQPSRKVRQFLLEKDDTGEYLEPGEFLELKNGDALKAGATSDDVVDFIIFGAIT